MTADYAAAVLSAVVLTVLAMESPVFNSIALFRMVDTMALGLDVMDVKPSLTHLMLLAIQFVVGDALWAGKALGVLSGVGCVVFSTRMFGPWAGLWVLAQTSFLVAVKDADPVLPALCFFLCAMGLSARGLSKGAGIVGAIAVGCATWVWPLIVAVLWVSHQRIETITWLAIGAGLIFFCGVPMVPVFVRPDLHLGGAIMGHPAWMDLGLQVGLLAIVWGTFRRNRASRGLGLTLMVGLVGAMAIPSTPSHLLHLQICIALGVAAVEVGPALLLGALIVLGFRLPDVWSVRPEEAGRRSAIQAMNGRKGQVMCTTRTFIRRDGDGVYEGCVGLESVGLPATQIYPHHVWVHAQRMQVDWFVVEDRAVLHTYPWLQDLLEAPYPDGFSPVVDTVGWRVFRLNP